jgi:hypothetical protein
MRPGGSIGTAQELVGFRVTDDDPFGMVPLERPSPTSSNGSRGWHAVADMSRYPISETGF